MPPPHWALLQRELLRAQADGCRAFFNHYFDSPAAIFCACPAGAVTTDPTTPPKTCSTGRCFTLLGGADDILDLYKLGWEGHLQPVHRGQNRRGADGP